MSNSLVIYLCIFAGGFLAFQAVLGMGKQAATQVRLANDRMKKVDAVKSRDLLPTLRKASRLEKTGRLASVMVWFDTLVIHSGLPLERKKAYLVLAGITVFSAICAYGIKGSGVWLAVGAVVGFALPLKALKIAVTRRRNKAVRQLPEALDVIIRALRAGYPVPVAMGLVAREMPDPIGSEFSAATDEISYGSGVSEAMQRMVERIGHDDFMLFSAIIKLQEKTGGNLAELLTANAKTIRDRQKMRLKIKAASAEGRMSATILNAAPLCLFGIIKVMSPEFYGDVAHSPIVNYSLWGILVWMAIGNLIMRRMINFKI
jgi:tight adherence protein B